MEKCVLEHCEFQQGGQCCLVCPKGFYRPNPRKEAQERIERCIKMLRRVQRRLPPDKANGLPRGVVREGKRYSANITYKGLNKRICVRDTPEEAAEIRADAMEAKENGVFDLWLKNLKAERKAAKKAQRTQKKGAAVGGDKEQRRAGILSEGTDAPSTDGAQEVTGTV